ncbi:uncharacterized protein [Ambystoma mexicanum]|uniref:uncharacterized protein isoform X1 n=1 Tax=Ambystoma mexicanum TaxID=8296 RepID=UPI0037E8E780
MSQELWIWAKAQVLSSLRTPYALETVLPALKKASAGAEDLARNQMPTPSQPPAQLLPPSKANNPVKASRTHQDLHKELLLTHRKFPVGRRSGVIHTPFFPAADPISQDHMTPAEGSSFKPECVGQWRGLGLHSKPELLRVLEKRRCQGREGEEPAQDLTPLQLELQRRQQRREEKQQKEAREEKGSGHEFLKVRENLRKSPWRDPTTTRPSTS